MATTRPRSPNCVKTEPFKLKRLLPPAPHNRLALAAIALLAGLVSPNLAQARDTLIWVLRDFHDGNVATGSLKDTRAFFEHPALP